MDMSLVSVWVKIQLPPDQAADMLSSPIRGWAASHGALQTERTIRPGRMCTVLTMDCLMSVSAAAEARRGGAAVVAQHIISSIASTTPMPTFAGPLTIGMGEDRVEVSLPTGTASTTPKVVHLGKASAARYALSGDG